MTILNKSDIVNKLVAATGYSKKGSAKWLAAYIRIVEQAVAKGEEVRLIGFGKMKKNHRKARKGRNPQTGKPVEIAARDVPVFTPGSSFKKAVNNK